jgi:antitoxin FitA
MLHGRVAVAIIDSVAQLIVRNIEDEVVEALKLRAAQHGRSAEAEHRELLRAALLKRPSTSLKEHLLAFPDVGEDAEFDLPRQASRRVDL